MTKTILLIILVAMLLATLNANLSKPLPYITDDHFTESDEVTNMDGNGDSEIQYVCDLYPKCLHSGLICCPTSTQPENEIQLGYH